MEHRSYPLSISTQTIGRLPTYLSYLKSLDHSRVISISAPAIARALALNEVQVRKDLAAAGVRGGRPKTGFILEELIDDLVHFLGCDNVSEAVLAGVGNLGRTLLSYEGFERSGMKIVAGFDVDPHIIGQTVADKMVYPMDKLESMCRWMGVQIGIIAVPAPCAQEACDRLVQAGMLAIWNFAPVHLTAPDDVLIQNENMAVSMAILSKRLSEKLEREQSKRPPGKVAEN